MHTDLIEENMSLKEFIENIVGMSFEDYQNKVNYLDKILQGEINVESDLARLT
ncbi:hypothetical protein [Legionella micdadei]|uniref:Uncharacterized protein n=1 Tax=Legionella micdadei TaxID=451 RepID=A0A098GG39_LEGMI|nr:hypothetical protein [Legionella micdadei]KTD27561.1 hypothetical protein Lmic_1881 [Legionella micdadei]CEG60950.1 protein of unknown function [Legionella micdadei]SCY69406.1 hypothetical protein SAMN02982997_02521 [Legionella micdadei]